MVYSSEIAQLIIDVDLSQFIFIFGVYFGFTVLYLFALMEADQASRWALNIIILFGPFQIWEILQHHLEIFAFSIAHIDQQE